jgi:hypothetical protein
LPGAIDVGVVQPVSAYGYVTTTLVTSNEVLPLFVIVSVCGRLEVPSGVFIKLREVVLSVGMAVALVPYPFIFTA